MLIGQGTLIAGRYLVERKIGEGSWGEVWLGHHTAVGMRVAIKALLDAKAGSHDAVVRFEREAKFLGRIQSDYVARVLDFVNDDVYGLVLVMELVEGDSLADVLIDGRLSVERAIDIGFDLVSGLCDLHSARVVHRDMKPGNVILRPIPDGTTRAVIIDFSLGRLVERAGEESSLTQLTGASMSVGTVQYMSPEQVLDGRKATFASDMYSVGALLFRCVSGEYVFGDGPDGAIARKKVTAEAPKLETGRTDAIAIGFENVIARALKRRPEDRYPDTRAMLTELADLRTMMRAPPAESAPPVSEKPPRRDVGFLVAGGAGLIAVGIAIGFAMGRARSEPTMSATTVLAPISSAAHDAASMAVANDAGDVEAGATDPNDDDSPASTLSPVAADTPPTVPLWRPMASSAPAPTASPTTSVSVAASAPSPSSIASASPIAPTTSASIAPTTTNAAAAPTTRPSAVPTASVNRDRDPLY